MQDELVDRIYEAAFVPEMWPPVLDEIGAVSGSASGALQILKGKQDPLWTATDLIRDTLGEHVSSGRWRTCARPAVVAALDYAGFLCAEDYMRPEQLAQDPVVPLLRNIGLGWQVGTLIAMPSGEHVGVTFERRFDEGRHDPRGLALLDGLRPHLARAALIAARLGLERARTTVATLEALGLPAAVMTATGRMLAGNSLLDEASDLRPAAHDRLALAHPGSDRLLREAFESSATRATAQSIPVPATEDRPPGIVHVLPLRGAANDVFGGAILVVLTAIRMSEGVPDLTLLRGLFDLTPKEARLATALAVGRSLKEAAQDENLRISTARSYLEQILRKTGTNQQSQLVALLKGARLVATPSDRAE